MKKVLIVDDKPKMREMYSRFLNAEGFLVTAVGDAQQVVEALMSNTFDLVLLDIKIPWFDGKEIYTAVHEHDPVTKIIVFSVYPIEKQKRLVPGADGYFDKSWGFSSLFKIINGVLGISAQQEAMSV